MANRSNLAKQASNWVIPVIGVLLAGAVLLLILFPTVRFLLHGIGAILVTADPLEASDAAVILSGGDNTRINEAALLFQEKYMDFVILTETGATVPEWDTEYSSLMRFKAIQEGIPPDAILITEQSASSTRDEARATLKLMNRRGFDSLIVITDPYHTLRTRLIFRDLFADTSIRVIVHPVSNHWYHSTDWWLHMKGWRITIQEYLKLVGYWIGLD